VYIASVKMRTRDGDENSGLADAETADAGGGGGRRRNKANEINSYARRRPPTVARFKSPTPPHSFQFSPLLYSLIKQIHQELLQSMHGGFDRILCGLHTAL